MRTAVSILFKNKNKLAIFSEGDNPFLVKEIPEGEEIFPNGALKAANSVLATKIKQKDLNFGVRLDGCGGFGSTFLYIVEAKSGMLKKEPDWEGSTSVVVEHRGLKLFLDTLK